MGVAVINRTTGDSLARLKFAVGDYVHHTVYKISGRVVERSIREDIDSVYASYVVGYSAGPDKIITTECHEKWLEPGARADYE